MKKIYILLMHTNTIPAKLIRKVTNYKYSHVGIALQKDCNVIYSFGRKKLHSFLDAGFCAEYKDGEFFKTFHKTMCTSYEVPVTEEQYERVKDIIHAMLLHSSQYQYRTTSRAFLRNSPHHICPHASIYPELRLRRRAARNNPSASS